MTSRFEDDFAAGLGDLFFHLGESATYTPAGGDPVTLWAIPEREMAEEEPGSDGRRRRRVRGAKILTDPDDADYGGVAEPAENATMTIGGTEYAVQSVEAGVGFARLGLVRIGSVESGRPQYRQR